MLRSICITMIFASASGLALWSPNSSARPVKTKVAAHKPPSPAVADEALNSQRKRLQRLHVLDEEPRPIAVRVSSPTVTEWLHGHATRTVTCRKNSITSTYGGSSFNVPGYLF